jgi:6-phosphogluconolactonase (cycloisomerase 2 family)
LLVPYPLNIPPSFFPFTGKYAYVLSELSNTIDIFSVNPSVLSSSSSPPKFPATPPFSNLISSTSTIPLTVDPSTVNPSTWCTAEIALVGRNLYASNRKLTDPMTGTDTVAHFVISPDGDKLDQLVEHVETGGRQPRAFVLFGGEEKRYALVGNIAGPGPSSVVFERDAHTGKWTRVAKLQLEQGKGHTAFALVQ